MRKRQRGFPKAKVDRQGSAKLAARANHFQLPCPKTEAVIGQKDNRVETEKFPEAEGGLKPSF